MPKVSWLQPQMRQELKVIRDLYGERITKGQVGKLIGAKNYTKISEWLEENQVTVFRPFKRDLYSTAEVLEKLWATTR